MLNKFDRFYLIGIGGIGMSALARFFSDSGFPVAGYDLVKTDLTRKLQAAGIAIHYEDNPELIPGSFKDTEKTLIIYTPAIPNDHKELNFFLQNNFTVVKRSDVLAEISKQNKTIAIAGTHGKTTITSITAHIFKQAGLLKAAFVGGILKNYDSNYIKGSKSDGYILLEADEYDRTFLKFSPDIALVSALDTDHLDIYKTREQLKQAFVDFLGKVPENGIKIINKKVNLDIKHHYTYAFDQKADFFASGLKSGDGKQIFNVRTPQGELSGIETSLPGKINVENIVAAVSISVLAGIDFDTIKNAVKTFKGIERRFEKIFENEKFVFYTDYAHLPEEIEAFKEAITSLYPGKKILAVFQPHLYSRTRDLAEGFAKVLDSFDRVIVAEIYPAREKPIKGISCRTILDKMKNPNRTGAKLADIPALVENSQFDILLTIGAGNIVNLSDKLVEVLKNKAKK